MDTLASASATALGGLPSLFLYWYAAGTAAGGSEQRPPSPLPYPNGLPSPWGYHPPPWLWLLQWYDFQKAEQWHLWPYPFGNPLPKEWPLVGHPCALFRCKPYQWYAAATPLHLSALFHAGENPRGTPPRPLPRARPPSSGARQVLPKAAGAFRPSWDHRRPLRTLLYRTHLPNPRQWPPLPPLPYQLQHS